MNKEEMRFKAAAMAMQGILAKSRPYSEDADEIPKLAVQFADALLSAFYPAGEEPKAEPTYGGWRSCPHCGKPMTNNPPPWGFPTLDGGNLLPEMNKAVSDAHNAEMERVTK